MLLGRIMTILDILRSTLIVFILFNEFNDDKSDCSKLELRWCIFEFEVGERDFGASENERLTVFLSVIIMQFVALNYSRCVEKSRVGEVVCWNTT